MEQCMERRERRREESVAKYLKGCWSYREMETRYGISCSTIDRWVHAAEEEKGAKNGEPEKGESDLAGKREGLSAQVKRLEAELQRERLHTKLLNAMIDIAEDQMGVSIREKPGAKR